jgi:hypothetical protein
VKEKNVYIEQMQARNSLVPTKSVQVNIGSSSKYLMWVLKMLFYVCVLTIATKLISQFSQRIGFDFNYVLIILIIIVFAYHGQMNQLIF